MKVEILKDGVYNGPRHKRLGRIKAGTVIEVEPAYGAELIEGGLARVPTPKPEPKQEPKPKPEEAEKPKRRRRRKKAE